MLYQGIPLLNFRRCAMPFFCMKIAIQKQVRTSWIFWDSRTLDIRGLFVIFALSLHIEGLKWIIFYLMPSTEP